MIIFGEYGSIIIRKFCWNTIKEGKRVMELYNHFVAKTDKNDNTLWLPLWMHLRDTAGVMKKIIDKWLPISSLRSTGITEEELTKVALFLAYMHDLGKANSYFQSIITKNLPEKRLELEAKGFVINDVYLNSGKTPHAYVSEEIFRFLLKDKSTKEKIESYASVLGAHHGKPKNDEYYFGTIKVDYLRDYEINIFGKEGEDEHKKWIDVWNDILEDACELCEINKFDDLPLISIQAQTILSGLLIMADWMASNQFYFKLIQLNERYNIDKYENRITKAWNLFEFPERWQSEINYLDENIFKERFGFFSNEVQKTFIDIVNNVENPGLFILEAQMGVGKTEAALAAAEVLACHCGASGIFFGLPTQATSNGLFPRLIEWAKMVSEDTYNSIVLAHGSANLNEEYQKYNFVGNATVNEDAINEGLEIHPWFQGNKKSLLADFVVGTVDQFLLAALKRKHFMLRHLGLAGKVVVIDECHAYDTYMNEYMLASLRWMGAYGVPVIMLSATLPKDRRQQFICEYSKHYIKSFFGKKQKVVIEDENWKESDKYPLFTWTDGLYIKQKYLTLKTQSKVVKISYERSIDDMLMKIHDKTQEDGCACIIANTVGQAQEIYLRAQEKMKGYNIILYHAQFVVSDRLKKEEELLRRLGKSSTNRTRKKTILIGTQVLEQSLDYDADILVTQLCPIDLLLQRMGRLHRHERNGNNPEKKRPAQLKEPEIIILLNGEDEEFDTGSKKIYGNFLLKRTMKELSNNENKVVLPMDISRMVQRVYDIGKSYNDEEVDREEYERELQDKKRRGEDGYTLGKPSYAKSANMDNMLNAENISKEAEAAVRDGVSSIDVILLKKVSEGYATILDDDSNWIDMNQVPSISDAKKIATQKLRLPSFFSNDININNTLDMLEMTTMEEVPKWQEAPWLNGELFLFCDEYGKTSIGNYEVSYTFSEGFKFKKRVNK